jgi:putative ABC transport system permease protein
MLNLLAGILTMIALYSINLRIMGRPNIALVDDATLFSYRFDFLPSVVSPLLVLIFIAALVAVLLYFFLTTELGLGLRATGSNARMARAQGVNDERMIRLGLGISNALTALAGALFAQSQGFADVTMGVGTIVYGLAAVILGEALIPIRHIKHALVACFIGAIVYRFVIAIALNVNEFGLHASDLNLVTAALVAFAMKIPSLKKRIRL